MAATAEQVLALNNQAARRAAFDTVAFTAHFSGVVTVLLGLIAIPSVPHERSSPAGSNGQSRGVCWNKPTPVIGC